MKKLITIAAIAAFASTGFSQVQSGPGKISDIVPETQTVWQTVFADYNVASDATALNPDTSAWSSSSAALNVSLSTIMANGGAMRVIYLGETAGWSNNFGVNIGGVPTTLLSGIQSPGNPDFGDWIYWTFTANTTTDFDLWFQSTGGAPFGGFTYDIFANTTNVRYSDSFEVANYSDSETYTNLTTYLVGIEDWALNTKGADNDYNDFLFAVQFTSGGSPFTPVPEPSTYGLIGAAALLGLVMVRRFKAKK